MTEADPARASSIYLAAAEGGTGKAVIALGLLHLLAASSARVGVFRPIVRSLDGPDEQLELLLAHAVGYVELFYGRPHGPASWELVTDALARTKSAGPAALMGAAKRLYGIVEDGDLAYVEERVDADGELVPDLSARLTRFVG